MISGKTRVSAMILVGLLGGCATGSTGSSNWLTVFVDNLHAHAVVVGTGPEDGCQVDARVTRQMCRYPWAGTADVELQVYIPSDNANHVARSEQASAGDRLCLTVRTERVQIRSC